jgi:hypothetical protein
MDAVNDRALEPLSRRQVPAGLALSEAERERTARIRGRGLVILQILSRGYSIGYVAQLRTESLGELVASLRDTLDALGAETVSDGVREARRRGLII